MKISFRHHSCVAKRVKRYGEKKIYRKWNEIENVKRSVFFSCFIFWNRTELVKCRSRNEINRSNFRPIYSILLVSRRVGRSRFKWIIIPYIILHSEFAYRAIALRRKFVYNMWNWERNWIKTDFHWIFSRTVDFGSFSFFWIEIWDQLILLVDTTLMAEWVAYVSN